MKYFRLGFTLIELMIVVVIMGIVSAAMIPHLNPDQGFKLQFLSQQVNSALSYAQQRAVASGCAVRVVWNTTTSMPDLYQYMPCNSNALSPQLIYTEAEGRSIAESGLPNNFQAIDHPATFYFDSLGEPYLESEPATRYHGCWTIGQVLGVGGNTRVYVKLCLNPLGYHYMSMLEDNR